MELKLIVAVDNEWGIGLDNQLLYRIPEDMSYFREKTENNIIVMGRKTFESLPKKKPLPNRVNIILTRQDMKREDDVVICHSIDEVVSKITNIEKDVYIIGGAEIYKQLLDYCSKALVTKVNASATKNKYFPNLDELDNWELVKESDNRVYNGIIYKFTEYQNNKVRMLK
ncbi:MAG: dihydrofolate reductase [Bacilli bacterium]|nr:dihydrofolate reductase [Bacilli bacterium]